MSVYCLRETWDRPTAWLCEGQKKYRDASRSLVEEMDDLANYKLEELGNTLEFKHKNLNSLQGTSICGQWDLDIC